MGRKCCWHAHSGSGSEGVNRLLMFIGALVIRRRQAVKEEF